MKFLIYIIYFFLHYIMGQDQLGSDIDGQAAWDWSGSSVSLDSDGNRLAIGAV